MKDKQSRPITKYIGLFAVVYYISLTAVSIIISITAIPMTGFYFILTICGSGSIPTYVFIKENGRLYTKTEKNKLIIGTFLCSIIIDLLNTTDVIGKMSIMKLGYDFVVMQIFNLLWILCTFGPLSRSIYQRYH